MVALADEVADEDVAALGDAEAEQIDEHDDVGAICSCGDRSVAIITVDGEYQDMMHRLKIEDGLIKEIEVTPSGYWWSKQFGGSSPFGVVHQTSQHEQAAAVAAIENYVKTELGDKPITWATQYELRNSCCQLSFTCDGLSYDVLVEIHSFDDNKCRFVMYSEYNGLIAECKENDHIKSPFRKPCERLVIP